MAYSQFYYHRRHYCTIWINNHSGKQVINYWLSDPSSEKKINFDELIIYGLYTTLRLLVTSKLMFDVFFVYRPFVVLELYERVVVEPLPYSNEITNFE